jgi:hypothetical protein
VLTSAPKIDVNESAGNSLPNVISPSFDPILDSERVGFGICVGVGGCEWVLLRSAERRPFFVGPSVVFCPDSGIHTFDSFCLQAKDRAVRWPRA